MSSPWFSFLKGPFLTLLFLSVTPLPANALDFSVFGSMTSSGYHFDQSLQVNSSRKLGFGGGATVGFELNPFLALETGVWILNHSFSLSYQNGSVLDRSFHFLDVPVLLRFSPLSQVAFYLGPYYGIQMGSTTSDFGFMSGLGYRYLISTTVKLRLDGFYQLGFGNLDTQNETQNSRNWIVLTGLQFETW